MEGVATVAADEEEERAEAMVAERVAEKAVVRAVGARAAGARVAEERVTVAEGMEGGATVVAEEEEARAEAMEVEKVEVKVVVRAVEAREVGALVAEAMEEGAMEAEAMEEGATEVEAMEGGATEGGATEAEATEEATEEGATEAEAMEGGATEAADEEEATGAAETLEAEAARSNNTCHPAPPHRCRSHQLHLRRTRIRKETQGGSCRYVRQPRRLQRSAKSHYVRPLRLRSRPWPESDHRLQLVKHEQPQSHRRHRHLRCRRRPSNYSNSSSGTYPSRRPGRR